MTGFCCVTLGLLDGEGVAVSTAGFVEDFMTAE
jgi:hypothetical protein